MVQRQPALILAFSLLTGLGLGYVGGRAYFKPTAPVAPQSPQANTSEELLSETATGDGSPPASAASTPTGSILEQMRAATAKLTSAQRVAELKRLYDYDRTRISLDFRDHKRRLQYLALVHPEDIPALRNLALTEKVGRHSLLGDAIFSSWAEYDSKDMEGWLRANKTSPITQDALSHLGYRCAMEDAIGSWERMEKLHADLGSDRAVISQWKQNFFTSAANQDPQWAYRKALALTDNEERRDMVMWSLREMAGADLMGAITLARQIPDASLASHVEANIHVEIWEAPSPIIREVADMLAAENDVELRGRQAGQLLQSWYQRDPEAARAWIRENREFTEASTGADATHYFKVEPALGEPPRPPDPMTERTKRTEELTEKMAEEPDAALAELGKMEVKELEDVGLPVFTKLAESDPERAANAALTLGKGKADAQMGLLFHSIAAWMKQDPDAAQAWLKAQPPGGATDGGHMGVASYYSENDQYDVAMESILQIKDPRMIDMIPHFFGEWVKKDRDAAVSWLSRQKLPEAQRQKFQKTLESQ